MATLQSLLPAQVDDVDDVLAHTTPPNNVIHAIERIIHRFGPNTIEMEGRKAIIRYTLGCPENIVSAYIQPAIGIIGTIDAIAHHTRIPLKSVNIAKFAYYCLMDPNEVKRIYELPDVNGDFEKLIGFAQSRNLCNANIARMRKWQEIPRDEVHAIMVSGRARTEKDARREYRVRQIMKDQQLDHNDAERFLEQSSNVESRDTRQKMDFSKHAADRRARNFQQPMPVTTRDTRAPPDVDSRTHVIAVLGVDEIDSDIASPSTGDGWMVSDFYLWMHVLDSMGKSQEWITSMDPEYLVSKYCLHDKTTTDGDNMDFPVKMSWSNGFLHGDPFEDRVVVLDKNLLPAVRQKVTVSPHGVGLRDLFMNRLEYTLAEAEKDDCPVLAMVFAHGDAEHGGLIIGQSSETSDNSQLVSYLDISGLLKKYPKARLTMFMTSCYSGHWVETHAFQGQNMTVLAATGSMEESFGFEWSLSQRHCGGLFSSATVTELLKEPSDLPPDVDKDTSREYKQMVNAIVAEMLRLCLPVNIPDYGSKPVFTDPEDRTKFWRRTGYALHQYQRNYLSLRKVPASDPHPKANRKKFDASFIDDNDPAVLAWKSRHPDILDPEYPEATGGYGSTRRGLTSRANIQFLIRQFMESNPWPHLHDQKILARHIHMFKTGKCDKNGVLDLRKVLLYRIGMNDDANKYARALDFYKLPRIQEWSPITNHPRGSIMRDWGRYVLQSGIFERPPCGPWYLKPCFYLAWGALEAGMNEHEFREALSKLSDLKKGMATSLFSKSMASVRFSKSVGNLKTLLAQSWGKSRAQRGAQARGSLSDIHWT